MININDELVGLHKKIIKNGMFNTTMPEKDRQYIFAYISKKNNCDFCYTTHLANANNLGFRSEFFNKDLIDLIDKLYDDLSFTDTTIDPQIQLQIKFIILFANFSNDAIKIGALPLGKNNEH